MFSAAPFWRDDVVSQLGTGQPLVEGDKGPLWLNWELSDDFKSKFRAPFTALISKQHFSTLQTASRERTIIRMNITIFNKKTGLEAGLFIFECHICRSSATASPVIQKPKSDAIGRFKLLSPAENNPISLRKSPACFLSE